MEKTVLESGKFAVVECLPSCDFCTTAIVARYDFKTKMGPWANGCFMHWEQFRANDSLGTGLGQRLILSGETP